MAKIVFGGGHTLAVDGTPQDVRNVIINPTRDVQPFVRLNSGDETYLVNPSQVAYIQDDVTDEAVLDAAALQ